MRILVFQTTRMGDMLQTSPLVNAIRRKYPDAHITALVRGMSRTVAERHPDIGDVIVYDEDGMYLDLCAKDSDRLLKAYERAEDYIRLLQNPPQDMAYNCTHSLASAMLLKMAEIPEVVGAHLSGDWQFVLRGHWPAYFFTSVFHREYNDLNLCDITCRFVTDVPPSQRLFFDVRGEDRTFVDALFAEHGVGPDDFVACFQLGASEENKRWPETHFAELARLLKAKYQAKIFLLGVKDEARLGEVFEQHAPGLAVPLYGKTSIPQVAALLERTRVLVTNDTGTMHIAAAVGCPIALVSVGYVHFRETGPYGPGHCAIERRRARTGEASRTRDDLDERTRLRADQVMRTVELVLSVDSGQPITQIEESPELADADLFVTRFAPDGCLQWYPAIRRPLTEMDFLRIAYRAMWLDYLGAQRDKAVERQSVGELLRCYDMPVADALAVWRKEHGDAFDAFAEMAQRGIRDTEKLLESFEKGGAMRKAQQQVRRLMELDEEMRLFSELHHACKPLTRIARFERDNLEGADPRKLAQTTQQIYRDAFARARLARKKLANVAEVCETVARERR